MRQMRETVCALVVVGLLWGGSAFGQENKIGYVDVREVVESSGQAQAARQDLEAQVEERESALEEEREQVETLRKEVEKQSSLMSEEQQEEKQRELQRAMEDFRQAQQQAQADIETQQSKVLEDLYDRVSRIVNRIGEEEGYDLIATGPSAMYVADRIDLTGRVLRELNAEDGD
ncbi:MAG: OmpH family outer membrane protein [Thiohalorhabdus sp.]|uniref:OmpH family outer membrane protein n=1 Tax=Thiohalorhabdus sp. TaxID=3094134 RepID=UPI00397EC903